MKKLIVFPVLIVLAIIPASAQTKKIAFKSHSGSAENFSIALDENLFDMGFSNFGMAPQRQVKNAQLDSVIYISDSVAIMVTSEYCTRLDARTEKPVSDPKLWKAGRDSVFNHPLFSHNHSLDSIRKILKEQYHFKNAPEKVIFVGYDNKKKKNKQKKKKSSAALFAAGADSDNQSPFGSQFFIMIAAIFFLSALTAGSVWLWHRQKAKKTAVA